jgi:SAM-dependent methyltransferase
MFFFAEEEAEKLYNALFDTCSLEYGKTVSKAERQEKELTAVKSLIYGEVEFHSFAKVLRKIPAPKGAVFYDLGSGTGKAVFVARLLHDFSRCCGMEVLAGLAAAAAEVAAKYEDGGFRAFLAVEGSVELVSGSLLEADWSDGDVVFANSTCFDDDLMAAMGEQAEALKPGAYFVTFTKGLSSPAFEVMERRRYKM